ncbi:MAG: ABC transporter substrate-binding protein [Gammaproteobacteria bacterium HGW-Gammaproteobacteria-14]|nr:MAG: ABC transporter substrate-binding protein [Gammaproteobacteria bacterium HGW-Gammaproteobacteria-14]
MSYFSVAGFLRPHFSQISNWPLAALLAIATSLGANERPSHGYHPYGVLKSPADFSHFDYVNPNAPKGGTLKLLGSGDFDNLNPYILAGRSPANTPGLFVFGFIDTTDTLLMGSEAGNRIGDEAGSAYGLIAETILCHPSLDYCDFTLRAEARFQDGTPITAADVVFSFETLRDHGHPRYALMFGQIKTVTAINPKRVRFTFAGEHRRQLPLIAGQLPVLPKHYWQERDFTRPTLEAPVISGPYRIASVQPGRQIVFQRDPNYWGKDLPVNRGRYNFDQVVVDYYRDAQVAFEAFKAGGYDVHLDYIAKHWATAYDFPATRDGRVIRRESRHQVAQGSQAFFINQRRAPFNDMRVRQALGLLFDYEWTNRTIFNGAYQRQLSWFPNSDNAAKGLPSNRELELLAPFKEQLPAALFEQPISLPVSDGSGRDRRRISEALILLREAGWVVRDKRMTHEETGAVLSVEILTHHNPGMDRVVQPWLRNLEAAGINASYRSVDPGNFKERLDTFDFDITIFVLPQNLFPGIELREYFHSESAAINGSRNLAGIQDPVVDALIDRVLSAETLSDYRAAVHALDRVLMWSHYTIPHWFLGSHRLAWWDRFDQPDAPMPYILGTETWWLKNPASTPH